MWGPWRLRGSSTSRWTGWAGAAVASGCGYVSGDGVSDGAGGLTDE